jgi:hypothetical protein
MSTIKVFPDEGTIPPACFYNFGGLAMFLNGSPELKAIPPFRRWVVETAFGINLPFVENAIISTFGISRESINICPTITNLSSDQVLKYGGEMEIYRRVYAHNSNAYVSASTMGWPNIPNAPAPIYYKFQTYHQYNSFKSGAAIINKLYPHHVMVNYWQIPFPIPCIN